MYKSDFTEESKINDQKGLPDYNKDPQSLAVQFQLKKTPFLELTDDKVLVMSLNILAEHLIDGECPSYKLSKSDLGPLRDHRLRTMNYFLDHFIDNTGKIGLHPASNLDILCLQEATDT